MATPFGQESSSSSALVESVREALQAQAHPEKALSMAAYMKTEMPFYGVQKEGRALILQQLVQDFRPADRSSYEAIVTALWDLDHREEKYLAIAFARHFEEFVVPASLPLYRRLIVEGAWWDFVDEVATHLIRHMVLEYPTQTWPVVERWIDEPDMWLRRTAILCQVGAKEKADARRLFQFCARRSFDKEFFIRKAIGWALREHARTDPEAVARFVSGHREELSRLSFREATKHLGNLVT